MTTDERKQALEDIAKVADQLDEVARRFKRLRNLANELNPSEPFVVLVHTAGLMARDRLHELGTLLEILQRVHIAPPDGPFIVDPRTVYRLKS